MTPFTDEQLAFINVIAERTAMATVKIMQSQDKVKSIRNTMTVKQTEKVLNICQSRVYQLIKAGLLEKKKLGRKTLITISSIEALQH